MPSILIISENKKEKNILLLAFEQTGFEILEAQPDRTSYLNAVQFKPDVVLIRLPKNYLEHINFCKNISKIKNMSPLILGFGRNNVASQEIAAFEEAGISEYFSTPLKFSGVMKYIESYFQQNAPEKCIWKNDETQTAESSKYFDLLFDKGVLPTKKIAVMVTHIGSLLAFPFTVVRVLKTSSDSKSGATDLARVIESDPVVSGQILKMANTVFFASRNNSGVKNIKNAIVRIGFRETKNIAMSINVLESLDSETQAFGFDRNKFWLHSLAVAVISNALSKNFSAVDQSEAFLTGLLHSFGIILLDEFFPDVLIEYLKESTKSQKSFVTTEKDMSVITHLDISRQLFEKWKIPAEMYEGISLSGDVENRLAASGEENDLLLWDKKPLELDIHEIFAVCIYSAKTIAKACRFGDECDSIVSPLPNSLLAYSNTKNIAISYDFVQKIKQNLKLYTAFLKLDDIAVPEKNIPGDVTVMLYLEQTDTVFPVMLYLFAQEVKPHIVTTMEKFKSLDSGTDLLIYCSTSDGGKNKITDYCRETRLEREAPLPVIIFENNPEKERDENTYYFSNTCDIRLIDSLMTELF